MMNISPDCWSMIVQFLSKPRDRLSVLLTSKQVNKSCLKQPIWFKVVISSKSIPTKDKMKLLRNIKLVDWNDELWNSIDFSNMIQLDCIKNNLYILPEQLLKCEYLFCSYNFITNLPELPRCKYLICNDNTINELPELPECIELDCSENRIQELPNLPKCKRVYCKYNDIIILNDLSSCIELDCSKNQLVDIPSLPKCNYLTCEDNENLIQIGELPECRELICMNCCLNDLPSLPNCDYLDCRNNFIDKFPKIPFTTRIYYTGNPVYEEDIDSPI